MVLELRLPNDLSLHNGSISFHTESGYTVTVRAVWQDSMPSGSTIGTVFCIHGSPGSHNDFKYIAHYLNDTGIRVIAPNFPGHGYTENNKRIGFHNADRNAFLQSVADYLGIKSNLLIVGHSRGCENALDMSVLNEEKVIGLILINPTGLRMHRGIRPFFFIRLGTWVYNLKLMSLEKLIMHPILYSIYNYLVRLKTSSGKMAAVCLQSMRTFSLGKQRPFIQKLNRLDHIKVVVAYSGKDYLIEDDIVREMVAEFTDCEELIIDDSLTEEAIAKASRWNCSKLKSRKTTAVCFKQDGHYLQKHKAKYIAEVIRSLFMVDHANYSLNLQIC